MFLYSDTCDLPKLYNSKVYCLIDNERDEDITWNTSKTEAEATKYYKLDGELLSINDVNENNFIDTSILSDPGDTFAWIGGKKSGESVWQWPRDVPIDDPFKSDIEPPDTPGADYLWYWINPGVPPTNKFNAAAQDLAGRKKYIIEFYAPLGSQFTCQGNNPGGCVNYYSSTPIEIEELNLFHRDG